LRPDTDDLAGFVAGFVAGEGCFTRGKPDREFRFAVGLGAVDRGMCELMRDYFGVGFLVDSLRRKRHYDDEVVFVVAKTSDLVEVIVPFMDAHLPASYKRRQYEVWRVDLLNYWTTRFRRVKQCSVEGCEASRRAKGLCRAHYYAAYGR
jgi:hypothetical protein